MADVDRQPKRQHFWVKKFGINHLHRSLRWAAGFKLGKAAGQRQHLL